MLKIWIAPFAAAMLSAFPLLVQAQMARTFVSGNGDDANPCARNAPCKTFAGAIVKTSAGGEIDTLDPGGFGAVTITKAITIAQEGSGEAGVAVAGTDGIVVEAGASDTVVLRGLQIDGGPAGSNSPAGIQFVSGGVLIVQNCAIRNFTGSPGSGIYLTSSGGSSLFVSDTVVSSNSGGGILVQPSGGSATANLVRVNSVDNGVGVEGDGASGRVDITVFDSVASGNAGPGFWAYKSATLNIEHSTSTHNGIGLETSGGPLANLRIGSSVVTGNGTGAIFGGSGSTMSSYGNNQIDGNTKPGSTIPVIQLK